MSNSRLSGFTLIELSVVLIIIGLIVGGVLVGKNLISAAAIRAQISQIERFKTAVITFRVKYDSLPGDMPNATNFWPADPNCGTNNGPQAASTTCNGNGDGMIVGIQPTYWAEQGLVWNHLSLAGLIPGYFQARTNNNYGDTPPGPGITNADMPSASLNSGAAVQLYMNSQSDLGYTPTGSTAGRHVFVVGYCPWGSGANGA